MGLSPRARGNRVVVGGQDQHDGSVPACAGQPRAGPKGRLREWVYPRVRVATVTTELFPTIQQGLSPRARGNLFPFIKQAVAPGLSPRARGNLSYLTL